MSDIRTPRHPEGLCTLFVTVIDEMRSYRCRNRSTASPRFEVSASASLRVQHRQMTGNAGTAWHTS